MMDCPLSPTGVVVFDDGCALTQMDTDQDGVNDAEDDFPLDRNESMDTDGDGVADTYDYYPDDATRSEQSAESGGYGGLLFAILGLLLFCAIAALLVVRNKSEEQSSPFVSQNYADTATNSYMPEEVEKRTSFYRSANSAMGRKWRELVQGR